MTKFSTNSDVAILAAAHSISIPAEKVTLRSTAANLSKFRSSQFTCFAEYLCMYVYIYTSICTFTRIATTPLSKKN